ncbi:DNA-3-methyladenine glycosylase family protein [Coraliomargarita parva]|uniref:DNA-3-methyladenine glycosylase family protein n=1 Tax=Coraliomargarita parva TaxID=3014050 RepID=UPI0022B345BA|nr:DNA glycosylase [Coraliomargarita parva]
MPSEVSFSPWTALPDIPLGQETSLAETLDGGQSFRWTKNPGYYEGRWADQVCRLRIRNGQLEWSRPATVQGPPAQAALRHYLAAETDFKRLTDELPWRSDPVLQAAIAAFPGLRILRQPFAETLFCFLCSSTKQIAQIKAICELVAQDQGAPLADGSHALPTWAQIAEAGEARLRAAKLGYRARFIHQTALFLQSNPGWLEATEVLPTGSARERLLQLPGVGRKIADCVLLFGAGRLEAFPIDTWVQKLLSRAYGLSDWNLAHLQDFARIHFGPNAGLAQQYLFAAARAGIIAA